jgi:hypothetical protein
MHVYIAAGGVQRNVGLYRTGENTSRNFLFNELKTVGDCESDEKPNDFDGTDKGAVQLPEVVRTAPMLKNE